MGATPRETGQRFPRFQKAQDRAWEGSEPSIPFQHQLISADLFASSMAYMEMTLVLAALFLELDMEFQDPHTESRQGYTPTDSFVLVRPQVRVRVRPYREGEVAAGED